MQSKGKLISCQDTQRATNKANTHTLLRSQKVVLNIVHHI